MFDCCFLVVEVASVMITDSTFLCNVPNVLCVFKSWFGFTREFSLYENKYLVV